MTESKNIIGNTAFEVLSSRPHWFIRNGTSVIFLLILIGIGVSSFVSFPETISIPIQLNCIEPQQYRESAKNVIAIKHTKPNIEKGEVIGTRCSIEEYNEVLLVEKKVKGLFHQLHTKGIINPVGKIVNIRIEEISDAYSNLLSHLEYILNMSTIEQNEIEINKCLEKIYEWKCKYCINAKISGTLKILNFANETLTYQIVNPSRKFVGVSYVPRQIAIKLIAQSNIVLHFQKDSSIIGINKIIGKINQVSDIEAEDYSLIQIHFLNFASAPIKSSNISAFATVSLEKISLFERLVNSLTSYFRS